MPADKYIRIVAYLIVLYGVTTVTEGDKRFRKDSFALTKGAYFTVPKRESLRGYIQARIIDNNVVTKVVPTAKITVVNEFRQDNRFAATTNPRKVYAYDNHMAALLVGSKMDKSRTTVLESDHFKKRSKTKKKRRKKREKCKKNRKKINYFDVPLSDQHPEDRLQHRFRLRPRYPVMKPQAITLHSPKKVYIPVWEDETGDYFDNMTCVRCPVRMTLMPSRLQDKVLLPVPPISICSRLARQKGKLNLAIVSGPRPGDILSQGNYPITLLAWKQYTQVATCNFTVSVEVRSCPELDIPLEVQTDCPSGAIWGSFCKFSCINSHHELHGSHAASCEEGSNGEVMWFNYIQPTCKTDSRVSFRESEEPRHLEQIITSRECRELMSPTHGTVVCNVAATNGRYPEGTLCRFFCYPGFAIRPQDLTSQLPFTCSAGAWTPKIDVTCKARTTNRPVTTPRINRRRTTKKENSVLRTKTKKPLISTEITTKLHPTSTVLQTTTTSTKSVILKDIVNSTTNQVFVTNATREEWTHNITETIMNTTDVTSIGFTNDSTTTDTSYMSTDLTIQDTAIVSVSGSSSSAGDGKDEDDNFQTKNGNSDVLPDLIFEENDIPEAVKRGRASSTSTMTSLMTTTQKKTSKTSLEISLQFSAGVKDCMPETIQSTKEKLKEALLNANEETCRNHVNCSGTFKFVCSKDIPHESHSLLTKWTFSAPYEESEYINNNNIPSAETYIERILATTKQELRSGQLAQHLPELDIRSNTFEKTPMHLICHERGFITNEDNECVQCPINTKEVQGECQPCSEGQYQDKVGQTDCINE